MTQSSFSDIVTYGVRDMWGPSGSSHAIERAADGVVFVIDSGVSDYTNDINLNKSLSRSWIEGEPATSDGVGHGTHIAGIIGAKANNHGIIGVAPGVEVISLKVVDNDGVSAPYQSFVHAVEYALTIIKERSMPLDKVVINFSMSAPSSPEIEQVVRRAADQGIRFSVSSGNTGVDVDSRSPANAGDHPNIYTVGAVDRFGIIPSWSNWDVSSDYDEDDIDGVAAGVDILSYDSDGNLIEQSGSSMAAAFVSGGLLIGDVVTGEYFRSPDRPYSEPALQLETIKTLPLQGSGMLASLKRAPRKSKRLTKDRLVVASGLQEPRVMELSSSYNHRLAMIVQSLNEVDRLADPFNSTNHMAGWVSTRLPEQHSIA